MGRTLSRVGRSLLCAAAKIGGRRKSLGMLILASLIVGASTSLVLVSGCSLAVMTGKVLMGDPKAKCQFRKATHTDLAKADKVTIVMCTASDSVRMVYPSAEFDILEGVTHRLKVHGVKKIVSPDEVAGWIDDHGSRIEDLRELADAFHAEYVIHIDVTKFTCHEEKSPNLLHGMSEGRVHAYQLKEVGSEKRLLEIMNTDFSSIYPQGNPVPIEKKSVTSFQQEYVERVTLQLSQIFYDHPVSEEIQ